MTETLIEDPGNLSYGIVTARFARDVKDGPDIGDIPEYVALKGTVTFTASVTKVIDATASPAPIILGRDPIVCRLDPQGYLCSVDEVGEPMYRWVKLIATDDPDLNPTNWTWQVNYNLTNAAGKTMKGFEPHSISVPSGSTQDLANSITPDGSQSVGIPQANALAAAAALSAEEAEARAIAAEASAAIAADKLVDSTEFVIETTADAIADPSDPLGVTAKVQEGVQESAPSFDEDTRQISSPFYWRAGAGNASVIAKPLGDGKGGVFDLIHDDDVGYWLHGHSGPNSGALTYFTGIGLDKGSGGGHLISAKNAGKGISLTSHPSHTGVGVDLTFYSSAADSFVAKLASGARPLTVQQKKGKGFGDGVAVAGGTGKTFTSATAAFVAGDVGKAISQLTSRGEAYCIDTGTTIASVNSGTSVELSKPLLAAATGINFLVADRAVPTGQKYLSFFNSDDVEQVYFANNGARVNTTFEIASAPAASNHNSVWFAGSLEKFYTYSTGTDYVASELSHDAFGLRIQHYAPAGKGLESAPVRSFIGRNIGGAPAIGFLGASAVGRAAATADATDLATVIALANALKANLVAFGLKNP
jgi:hypothetical protein